MYTEKQLCIYVDVDETFLRNYGTKQISIPYMHIKQLHEQGAKLFCWSSGGSEYARRSAKKFGIEYCFVDFLPKPQVVIDDQLFENWRYLIEIHPNSCSNYSVDKYKAKIIENQIK